MTSSPRERTRAELGDGSTSCLRPIDRRSASGRELYAQRGRARGPGAGDRSGDLGRAPAFPGRVFQRTFLFRIAHNRALAHVARRRLPLAESDTIPEVEDVTPDPKKRCRASNRAGSSWRPFSAFPSRTRRS